MLEDDELLLEDWKMTKDRIKHFDDVVMRTRVQGLPIATAIQAVAFASIQNIGRTTLDILGFDFSVFSLIVIAGLVYLVPVLILDIVHFLLLISSVKHAIELEEKKEFRGKLNITHKLTGMHLTLLHIFGGYSIYAAIFVFGMYFAFSMKLPEPVPLTTG